MIQNDKIGLYSGKIKVVLPVRLHGVTCQVTHFAKNMEIQRISYINTLLEDLVWPM